MKSCLIKSAQLIWPQSHLDQKQIDVFIKNGKIIEISEQINVENYKGVEVIHAEGQYLAPGFFDLNANFGEPGLETKETLATGAAAAVAGGFTGLALQPNTDPPVHSSTEVSLLLNKGRDLPVDIFPVGALSKKREGVALAELYDMYTTGAVAFSDGNRSVQEAGLMSRALLYSKGFGGLIMSFAEDASLSAGSCMNEGVMSTYLGMKGKPNLSEALMVSRDLFLAEYNDAAIHFSTISTAESVALIRQAKAKGISVTCDVAAHHLVLTDDLIQGFDSNYKVNPPLRTKKDVKALLKGLKDGTVDAIVSQHTPHEIEFKNVEFQIAKNGVIGLQTVLPLALKAGLSPYSVVEKLAVNPRKILGLPMPLFVENEEANVVLFHPDMKWEYRAGNNRSKAINSPFIGAELYGRVTLTINKRQIINTLF